MEDIFDSLYVVVAIVIFISSIIRKNRKNQQRKTVKKPIARPYPSVVPPKRKIAPEARSAKPTSEFEAVREELAELFGIRPPKPPTPQPVKTENEVPVVKKQERYIPEKVIEQEEEKEPSWQLEGDRSVWQQRIIWTEVLGSPKAKRAS